MIVISPEMKEGYILLLKMNLLRISLYKTNDDVVAQLTPPYDGPTYPNVIHSKNKLLHIALWGLLFTYVMLNENVYIMFWAVTITSADSINSYA